jgi:predicted ATPase
MKHGVAQKVGSMRAGAPALPEEVWENLVAMIRRIYVDNFRCLSNFELRPDRVNLLLGKNGSGKSTFLDALRALAGLLAGESPRVAFPVESLPWWDLRRTQVVELEVDDGANQRFEYRVSIRHEAQVGPRIVEERLRLNADVLFEFSQGMLELPQVKPLRFEGNQSVLAVGIGVNESTSRFSRLVRGLLVFKLNPWSFDAQARGEERILNVDGSNLVAFLRSWSQENPEAFLRWKASALKAMPHLEDLQMKELFPGTRILAGTKQVDGRTLLLSLAQFSEGERVLLALHAISGLALTERYVALDEPDNFLAVSEVQPVLRSFTVDAQNQPAAQLFVITHHPESIDYLASYSNWLFEKTNEGVARVRRLEFNRADGERPTDALLAEFAA